MKNIALVLRVVIFLGAAAALSTCILPGPSSEAESEPNDTTGEATALGLVTSKTVYGRLSDSDSTDCYSFSKSNESSIKYKIIEIDGDLDGNLDLTLTPNIGSPHYESDDYTMYYTYGSQGSVRSYTLEIEYTGYDNGGSYALQLRVY